MRLVFASTGFAALHPWGSELDLDALAEAYSAPATDPLSAPATEPAPRRNWLRANMVSTLDGSAQGSDGRSGTINTPADHVVFEVLRALSDAVLVGAGTARAEGYGALLLPQPYAALRRRLGRPPELPLVLVSESGELPATLLQQRHPATVYVVTRARSAGLLHLQETLGPDHVVVAGDDHVHLAAGVDTLHDKGFRHILTEGGPHLLGSLLDADLVDELDLTLAPSVVGGPGRRIVDAPALSSRFTPRVLVEQDGTLMGRWFRDRS